MIQTDNIAIRKTVLFLIFLASAACEQTCNGLAGLCQLRLDQVTLAGTHNSGAGFDGHLWYGSGVKALSCFYRNQGASITRQLDLGIRYVGKRFCNSQIGVRTFSPKIKFWKICPREWFPVDVKA